MAKCRKQPLRSLRPRIYKYLLRSASNKFRYLQSTTYLAKLYKYKCLPQQIYKRRLCLGNYQQYTLVTKVLDLHKPHQPLTYYQNHPAGHEFYFFSDLILNASMTTPEKLLFNYHKEMLDLY